MNDLARIRSLDNRGGLIFMNRIFHNSTRKSGYTVVYTLNEYNEVIELEFLKNLQIRKLPDEIFNFKYLQKLSASSIGLTIFPLKLVSLKELISVDLSYNQITEYPPSLINLKYLKRLNLGHNKITKLPKEIANITRPIVWDADYQMYEYVDLYENPLIEPPIEVVKRGNTSIKNYFISLEFDTERLFESKLIVVGQGGVGKTFLINRLVKDEIDENEPTTEGIDIVKWEMPIPASKDFVLNVWDFGGQEIYHSTHQFFLTKRSVYLLVWAARFDDDLTGFDYWLSIIKLLSSNSPVIIVQNKIDERIKDIDENSLKSKFPNIVGFFKVSAITGEGIDTLKDSIKHCVSNLDHIGDLLPKNWMNIRKDLESKKSKNYISYSDYKIICDKLKLDVSHLDSLANYFHDLGLFLHFMENKILRNTVFLNPEWATNAVYKLIDTREVQNALGKFSYDMLFRIWSAYPEEKFICLIELMKKFELVFQIFDTDDYIIPELLLPRKPEFQWDYTHNLILEYQYEFMPAGIITRLIVRMHDMIVDNIYWKYGLMINSFNTDALIISNPLSKKINIWVHGQNKSELLFIIRREIDTIHKSLNRPIVKELVPCICKDCIDKSVEPEYFDFNILKRFYYKGRQEITCPRSAFDISIANILEVFEENVISRDKEIISILYELVDQKDNEKTLLAKANDILIAQPNFFGLGLNINNLVKNVIKNKKTKPNNV